MTRIDTNFRIDAQARAILALVANEEFEPVDDTAEIRAFPFYNGRERGICLEVRDEIDGHNTLFINFGEHRGSDEIYVDTWTGYGLANQPTIEDKPSHAHDERTMFNCHQTWEAAEHVMYLINMHIGEDA